MQVHAYLEHAFGAGRLQQMSAALAKPALHTCLRVNTLRTSPQVLLLTAWPSNSKPHNRTTF
jgi:hypothetical protein